MLPYINTFTVYHGTNLFSAKLLLSYGIMLDVQRKLTDFGKGFYVTLNHNQAKEWALVKTQNHQIYPSLLEKLNISENQYLSHPDIKMPACVICKINLECLLNLRGLIFPMPQDLSWPFYKKLWEIFINNCRRGIKHNYDFVYGPFVGRQPNGVYAITSNNTKDQLSLNSIRAIDCIYDLRIEELTPDVNSLNKLVTMNENDLLRSEIPMTENSYSFLIEIRNSIVDIIHCSYQEANNLIKNSWISSNISKYESTIMHESPSYWAFSILYENINLWYKDYESYVSTNKKYYYDSPNYLDNLNQGYYIHNNKP